MKSNRFTSEFYAVSVMQKPVHQRIGNRRVTHQFVLFGHRYLTDDGASPRVSIFYHLQQV
ncbi:hypothetical protein [Enterobacter asburiae]|uniref:hypothetical protein n=1 Tax=Enterobacter asburiae TaxID=61645 RepID=UPI00192B5589|nr:hypothetical protein [Enterobacter asburiae]MBL5926044.1 hypothetical protein [Enterobacter asburiae]MBL5956829.1 hypothetical protein [Enterobacter asburiae]